MRLFEVIALLEELKGVFPTKRSDRLFARIVASKVFGSNGGYFLMIKVNEDDWKLTPKILELISKWGLSVRPMADYWVIYDRERG